MQTLNPISPQRERTLFWVPWVVLVVPRTCSRTFYIPYRSLIEALYTLNTPPAVSFDLFESPKSKSGGPAQIVQGGEDSAAAGNVRLVQALQPAGISKNTVDHEIHDKECTTIPIVIYIINSTGKIFMGAL